MWNHRICIASFFLVNVLFWSCTSTPPSEEPAPEPNKTFSNSLKIKNKLSAEDIKKIQFYLSNSFILERKFTQFDKNATGTLYTYNNTHVEQIVFKAKTPVVAREVFPNSMHIGLGDEGHLVFAGKGGSDYTLIFEQTTAKQTLQNRTALNELGYGNNTDEIYSKGIIEYNGVIYYLFVPGDKLPTLMLREVATQKNNLEKTQIQGEKIDGSD